MAKKQRVILKVRIKKSQGYYTAYIPKLGITDYAKTKKALMKSLMSAISLALEDMAESKNLAQRKEVSQIVSESITRGKIPVQDIVPLTQVVSNILVSEL